MNTWDHILDDIIAFHNLDGFMATRFQDILFCRGEGSYTFILVKGQPEFMLSKNLKAVQKILPENLFLRVHQKYLVNKLHIRRYLVNGKQTLLLSNGDQIKVSDRQKKVVAKCFNAI
jgi:two-component system LytT family response regulator